MGKIAKAFCSLVAIGSCWGAWHAVKIGRVESVAASTPALVIIIIGAILLWFVPDDK